MPRTITNNDLKDRRDLSAWRIELNGYDMSETNAKHESAVKELAEREEKRIDKLKDTLWKAAVPFFGINITPEKLKEKFENIMNAECNIDAVLALMNEEEERVRQIEAEDAERVAELKKGHTKLIKALEKAKGKAETKSEDSPASDSDSHCDEPADDEIETDESITAPVELDKMPEELVSEEPKT